jgi:hypothetical protein
MSKIMYVCEFCEHGNSEACGHWSADELKLTPDGKFQVCESCWDDDKEARRNYLKVDNDGPVDDLPKWKDLDPATDIVSASRKVYADLNARIDAAPSTAKPVFVGLADLHDALGQIDAPEMI